MKSKITDNKKINRNIAFSLMGMGLMLGLGACNASQDANAATVRANVTNSKSEKTQGNETSINVDNNTVSINGDGASSEGKIITISKAGNYRLKGNLSEGQIVVNSDGDVNLNLDNFTISNSTDAPIVGKSGNINIKLIDGSDNTISDMRAANTQDENSTSENNAYDAAVYSEEDINLTGSGKLTVEGGYEDAIHSKSNLNIESGIYSITASHHGLNGKKTLVVKNGNFDITTVEDAMHSKGDVTFENGEMNINAGDDALHSDNTLTVKDGKINIAASNEGLEGITVNIEGGNILVNSSDDGINAAGDSTDGSQVSYAINISGGDIKIIPGGDGIDSNGDLNISGGNIVVDGPSNGGNAPIDYDGTGTITGGSILATGNSGMFQGFNGNNSTQSSIIYYLDNNAATGATIKISDESGKELFTSADQTQSYNAVLYSSAEIESGKNYKVSVGNSEGSVTAGNSQGGNFGQPPQGGMGGNGQRPQGQPPEMNGNFQGREGSGQGRPPQGQPPEMNGNFGGRGGNGQGQPPQGQPPEMNENFRRGGQGNNQSQPPQGQPPEMNGNFGGVGQGNGQGRPPMGQPPQGGNQPQMGQLPQDENNQSSKNNSDSKKKKNKKNTNQKTGDTSGKEK